MFVAPFGKAGVWDIVESSPNADARCTLIPATRVYVEYTSSPHIVSSVADPLPRAFPFFNFQIPITPCPPLVLQDAQDWRGGRIRRKQLRVVRLQLKLLGLLPGEVGVGEVSVLGRLAVDGLDEVELLDNDTGPEVKVLVDDSDELFRSLVRGSIGLDEYRQRLGHTDSVRELHKGAAGEAGSDERLCDPSCEISGRAVDLE